MGTPSQESSIVDDDESIEVTSTVANEFRSITTILESSRNKKVETVLANVLLHLNKLQTIMIERLDSEPKSPSTYIHGNHVLASQHIPQKAGLYSDALRKAAEQIQSEPETDIPTIVYAEMKRAALTELDTSRIERIRDNELQEQEKRTCNVMIFGVPEKDDDHDIAVLKDLLKTCSVHCKVDPEVFRVGKTSQKKANGKSETKIRPIKVCFKNRSTTDSLFANLSVLRGNERYEDISVRHDLTLLQMSVKKELMGTAAAKSVDGKVFRVVGRPNNWRIIQKSGPSQ